ncbi:MAG: endonuclease domain-containing protein [Nitrosomonadales bacterium]|nr:endonuclease domain-containing protein [Nitrosomonadales bacterium]
MTVTSLRVACSPRPPAGEGLGERAAEDKSEKKARRLSNAKALRTHQTDAEQRLWYHLRAHRFMDLKFKRQKPMGRYIVDFVCMERRLIIELDGGQHGEQMAYDRQRDDWLCGQGYTVLRFWNNEVMQQMEEVLEQIHCALTLSPNPSPARAPSPQSSPASGRGGERERPCSIPGRGELKREAFDDPARDGSKNQSPRPPAGEGVTHLASVDRIGSPRHPLAGEEVIDSPASAERFGRSMPPSTSRELKNEPYDDLLQSPRPLAGEGQGEGQGEGITP